MLIIFYDVILVMQITHVIKEIQLFQQTPYRIEHHRRVIAVMLLLSIMSFPLLVINLLNWIVLRCYKYSYFKIYVHVL